jgi:hypothetical protein
MLRNVQFKQIIVNTQKKKKKKRKKERKKEEISKMYIGRKAKQMAAQGGFLMHITNKPARKVFCNGNQGRWRPQQEGKHCKSQIWTEDRESHIHVPQNGARILELTGQCLHKRKMDT